MEGHESSVESTNLLPCHVLPFGRRIAYSFGHILNDLCASMWFTYLQVFQQSVLRFSSNVAGRLFLLGQIADAIATPFVGFESDRRNSACCQYGRRKSWHLVGTICVACTFPFLFMKCIDCSESSETAKFVYYAAFIVIFQFGWASTQVSHLSLIPDLTPLSSERVKLNAIRYAMTVMSNICVYSTLWVVLGVNSSEETHIGPRDASVFMYVSLAMTGLGLFFSILFHVFVKENPVFPPVSDQPITSSSECYEKPHLKWKDWFKQPQFYMVALLYVATRLYINISQIYMPLYIEKSLDLHKNNIAIIPLVIYVSSFLSSFLVKYLNIHLGNKVTYFVGCVLALAACIWMFIEEGDNNFRFVQIYVVAVLIGIAGCTLLVTSLSVTSDLISNSISSGAFVFGCMSFVDKLANGVAVIVIQDFHPCIHCCADCKWYYEYVLVFACGGAVILGLGALAMLLTQNIGIRHNERFAVSQSNGKNSKVNVNDDDDDKPLLMNDDDDEH